MSNVAAVDGIADVAAGAVGHFDYRYATGQELLTDGRQQRRCVVRIQVLQYVQHEYRRKLAMSGLYVLASVAMGDGHRRESFPGVIDNFAVDIHSVYVPVCTAGSPPGKQAQELAPARADFQNRAIPERG